MTPLEFTGKEQWRPCVWQYPTVGEKCTFINCDCIKIGTPEQKQKCVCAQVACVCVCVCIILSRARLEKLLLWQINGARRTLQPSVPPAASHRHPRLLAGLIRLLCVFMNHTHLCKYCAQLPLINFKIKPNFYYEQLCWYASRWPALSSLCKCCKTLTTYCITLGIIYSNWLVALLSVSFDIFM